MIAEKKAAVDEARSRLAAAEAELEAAKQAHAEGFRTALVALCNEHGFTLEGSEYSQSVYISSTGALVTEDDFAFSD